jgi:ABC-type glycerol-3-phosphate transport system substrate-binding protein
MLEVVFSADKIMKKQTEEKFNAELMAVDVDQIVHEYQSTINKKQKAKRATDFDDDDDDDLNAIDLDLFITC